MELFDLLEDYPVNQDDGLRRQKRTGFHLIILQ
jgi:hypothetical protein